MPHRTIEQIEALIGEKLRTYRLDQNLTQDIVASKAGISRGSLVRLENGQNSSLTTFIAAVKALQLEDWFESLAPISAINPLLLVENQPRQRARKTNALYGP
jgi:transcriptional regulator with XRE-family HTH domain